jgi:hypothetical protein
MTQYYPFDKLITTAMDIMMGAEFKVSSTGVFMNRHQWATIANSLELAAVDCRVDVASDDRVKTVTSDHLPNLREVMSVNFAKVVDGYPDRAGEYVARMYNFAARRALTSRRM